MVWSSKSSSIWYPKVVSAWPVKVSFQTRKTQYASVTPNASSTSLVQSSWAPSEIAAWCHKRPTIREWIQYLAPQTMTKNLKISVTVTIKKHLVKACALKTSFLAKSKQVTSAVSDQEWTIQPKAGSWTTVAASKTMTEWRHQVSTKEGHGES